MTTIRQKAALEKLVEIGGHSVSKAMRESQFPYSPKTAKNPKKLTDSKGFKEEMERYGLTKGFITKALVNDIKRKPKKRFLELSLGADILGMKKRIEPGEDARIQIIILSSEVAERHGIRIASGAEADSPGQA